MNVQTRIISAIATAAVGFAVTRAVSTGWRLVMKQDPPEDIEDPDIQLRQALAMALISATVATTAQTLVMRQIRKRAAIKQLAKGKA